LNPADLHASCDAFEDRRIDPPHRRPGWRYVDLSRISASRRADTGHVANPQEDLPLPGARGWSVPDDQHGGKIAIHPTAIAEPAPCGPLAIGLKDDIRRAGLLPILLRLAMNADRVSDLAQNG
jgi:hypothetical protein